LNSGQNFHIGSSQKWPIQAGAKFSKMLYFL
jgi:hypothetical protein